MVHSVAQKFCTKYNSDFWENAEMSMYILLLDIILGNCIHIFSLPWYAFYCLYNHILIGNIKQNEYVSHTHIYFMQLF